MILDFKIRRGRLVFLGAIVILVGLVCFAIFGSFEPTIPSGKYSASTMAVKLGTAVQRVECNVAPDGKVGTCVGLEKALPKSDGSQVFMKAHDNGVMGIDFAQRTLIVLTPRSVSGKIEWGCEVWPGANAPRSCTPFPSDDSPPKNQP